MRCFEMGTRKYENYEVYESDYHTAGSQIKLEHTVYAVQSDLTELISKSPEELSVMLNKALDAEEKAYKKVITASYGWEPKAMATRLIERAMEYQNTPEVQHSSNQWVSKDDTHKDISNKVYHMHIFSHEYSSWRTTSKRWETKWYLSTNSPIEGANPIIAQSERSFKTKEEMDKYIQGRIKAYSHLFTEISPPIPDELLRAFTLHGHLLPGYTKASDVVKQRDEKPSVRDKLKDYKSQINSEPKKGPTHNRSEVQIE